MFYSTRFSICIDANVDLREVSLKLRGGSSTYQNNFQKWGPAQSLTSVSKTSVGYWHSKEEQNPWLVLQTDSFESDIRMVEIEDRKDCCASRFRNVEVSVGGILDVNTRKGKTSCGSRSYQGSATSYK